jgi:hypothetical protein
MCSSVSVLIRMRPIRARESRNHHRACSVTKQNGHGTYRDPMAIVFQSSDVTCRCRW